MSTLNARNALLNVAVLCDRVGCPSKGCASVGALHVLFGVVSPIL